MGPALGPGVVPHVDGLVGDTEHAGDLGLRVLTGLANRAAASIRRSWRSSGVRGFGVASMPYDTPGILARQYPPQRSVAGAES